MNRTVKEIGKKVVSLLPTKPWLSWQFKKKFGRNINWKNPTTFNEKLQWLKVYDRKPIYTTMVDKYEAKKYVADIIGEEYIIPTLGVWDRFEDIDFDALPDQFVLKCTHDSGGLVIVRNKADFDKEAARKKFKIAMNRNPYDVTREWPYKNVKPRIIAEQYMDDGEVVDKADQSEAVTCERLQSEHGLLDYKFLCFNGKARVLFLDIGVIGGGEDHAENYYRNVYDQNGIEMPFKETREHYPIPVLLPDNFKEMVNVAEELSKGIACLRVDLYRLNSGEIKVGELTFFHGSGMSNIFVPEEWDRTLGDWITLPEKG
ncbi:MAG: glycosyl transferase [Clostridia bacterium]|nr:glycosyl transferase [Clostridia bacterium]